MSIDGENLDNRNSEEDARNRRKEEAKLWLKYAMDDSDVAHYLYEGDFYPKKLEIICYHCSQAAEKSVKAVTVDLGSQGGLAKKHDMDFLLGQIKNLIVTEKGLTITDEMRDWGEELSEYSVEVRYPNEMEIDEYRTKKAIEHMDFFIAWAKEALEIE